MNRDEKSRLMITTRAFLGTVLPACKEYLGILDKIQSDEYEKLENIPDELSSTSIYEGISAGCDSLEEVRETIEDFIGQFEEIPDVLGLKMRKSREKPLAEKPIRIDAKKCASNGETEKRTERLQLVLTPSLLVQLKSESAERGISMNELVFRVLEAAIKTGADKR